MKIAIRKGYITRLCESIAKTFDQNIMDVIYENEQFFVKLKNHTDLILDENELKQILKDEISSSMRIIDFELSEIKKSENGDYYYVISNYDHE